MAENVIAGAAAAPTATDTDFWALPSEPSQIKVNIVFSERFSISFSPLFGRVFNQILLYGSLEAEQ